MTATLSPAPRTVAPAEAPARPPVVSATDAALLARLGDHRDHAAWRWFADRFAPVVYRLARRRGLQDCDAADVVQAVLIAAGRAALRRPFTADRFAGWLFKAARCKVYSLLAARARATGVEPGSVPGPWDRGGRHSNSGLGRVTRFGSAAFDAAIPPLEAVPAPEADPALDDAEERAALKWRLGRAMGDVQREFTPAVWAAFWEAAVVGRPAADVGADLGMTTNAVYQAKFRVARRLKERLAETA